MSHKQYRICFVAPNAYGLFGDETHGPIGGAEVQQMLLARALTQAGHDVHVIISDVEVKEAYNCDGITVHPCSFRYFGGNNIHFLMDTLRLIKLLKKIRADVNIVKCPLTLLFALSMYRRCFAGKLLFWLAHDMDVERRGWRSFSSVLFQLGIGRVDQCVFQNQFQENEGRRNYGLNGNIINNIAPDIDVSDEIKDIDVLWVGSCVAIKHPESFIALSKHLPQYSFRFVLSKMECNNLYDTVIAPELKNADNIMNLGQISYSEIHRIYARAKVLVCTSESEGFPNIFLQAWQQGVPVVSLKVDPSDIIKRNNLGFVSGDIAKAAEDIRLLLETDDLRRQMGERAKAYVLANHSSEAVVTAVERVLDNLHGV